MLLRRLGPLTADQMPSAAPRRSAGKAAVIIVSVSGMITAPPMPSTARAAISVPAFGASAAKPNGESLEDRLDANDTKAYLDIEDVLTPEQRDAAREIASDLMAAYIDGEVDQVDIFYNRYISPLSQEVTRETLLPLQHATIFEDSDEESLGGRAAGSDEEDKHEGPHALVEYEPGPEEILQRLVPAYVEISIYRALLESTASEHGARMSAMRNASDNAGELIDDLTLEANRQRQAEITQEIMEVVAGAESLI